MIKYSSKYIVTNNYNRNNNNKNNRNIVTNNFSWSRDTLEQQQQISF